MGQNASAAGQMGQGGSGSNSRFNEDAFRHFKDEKGAWSQSRSNEGDNFNHMSSSPHSMTHGPSGVPARKTREACPDLPFSYTDITRPNGPMDRASPMDREFSYSRSTDVTRPNGSPHGKHGSFSSHNGNTNYSPPPPAPCKAEASTMMSTAFLKRNYAAEDGGLVQFKIDTINEDGECQVSSCYTDGQQDYDNCRDYEAQNRCADGMVTYDEVQQPGAYGMVTYDDPVMEPPPDCHQHRQQPAKAASSQMYQAPPPTQSIDTSCSGFSSAWTSVSQQQHQQAPSTAGSSAPVKPANLKDELKSRETWAVGSVIEVFSSSAGKWYIAQLVQVGEKENAKMITVQFVGDNGQIMQKTMPRSDVQLASFGRNTRQMPPGFQKVASESRPGQFSYQDSSSGTKYQTKELAWQNYYAGILKSEQAQALLAQGLPQPSQQAAVQQLAAEKLKPAALQAAPTMSIAPSAALPTLKVESAQHASVPMTVYASARDVCAAHSGMDLSSGGYESCSVISEPGTQNFQRASSGAASVVQRPATSVALQPQVHTVGDPPSQLQPQSSGQQPSKPFPGYGQSFAVGTNAGYEAYLASQAAN